MSTHTLSAALVLSDLSRNGVVQIWNPATLEPVTTWTDSKSSGWINDCLYIPGAEKIVLALDSYKLRILSLDERLKLSPWRDLTDIRRPRTLKHTEQLRTPRAKPRLAKWQLEPEHDLTFATRTAGEFWILPTALESWSENKDQYTLAVGDDQGDVFLYHVDQDWNDAKRIGRVSFGFVVLIPG